MIEIDISLFIQKLKQLLDYFNLPIDLIGLHVDIDPIKTLMNLQILILRYNFLCF
jgi:hypothetical protein